MDQMVLRAQRFVNSYSVPGIPTLKENGQTSWAVMYALTRCLQYELGITALADNFGPSTLAHLQRQYPLIDSSTRRANLCRIVASGLYCKGYDGGGIDGTYNSRVADGVAKMKKDMGVDGVYADGITPKVFKALLTMDAYIVVNHGSDLVRSVQQWLNSYVVRKNFFIIPCDGHFSRAVQQGLVLVIQYTIGMSDSVANGVFGPHTRAGIKANTVAEGSTGIWVRLFCAAMIFNQRAGVGFNSVFGSDLAAAVRSFQSFVALPVTGKGGFSTWASLLVSNGDTTRVGRAADCVEHVTDARAKTLKAAGHTIVGRYLSNVANSSLNKMIQPGELDTIVKNGLRVFPIYETFGNSADYFSYNQGAADGNAADSWAWQHGFKPGTRIYFAVDFDALDYQVTDNIIPHFKGINDAMHKYHSAYHIGIYAPRNVCSRIGAAGLASASFAADMSTGFSGNLGYPMPANWAFDQITTVTLGSSPTDPGLIDIDNDIISGRDMGQNRFNPPPGGNKLDVAFDMSKKAALLKDVQTYLESIGTPESSADPTSRTTTECFNIVISHDDLLTRLARSLRIRKALIECPLLWEMRKYNAADLAADTLVVDYYLKRMPGMLENKRDSSVGLAQMFAATAIDSRNYCIRNGIISGSAGDTSSDSDMWAVWQKLHDDDNFNISTVPLVLIYGASEIGQRRPALDYSQDETRKDISRYNGTGSAAEKYGHQLIGLYNVFEQYYSPLRSR